MLPSDLEGGPVPEFHRRRELGGASARSLLLTLLGEFVLPAGQPVWTATLLRGLSLVGVEEKAIRQALARSAAEGWLSPERDGRRTRWRLTPAGSRLLTEGADRIYGLGTPGQPWDGQWLIVLASVPETDRRRRHLLRTRLSWNGLGNLSAGIWLSPHQAKRPEVTEALTQMGVEGATIFVGTLGDLAEDRRVAAQAWDLAEIERAYEDFQAEASAQDPTGPAETFAAQIRLVQEWRRFPFLDPALPPELLPAEWSGAKAATTFRDRHRTWQNGAESHWRNMMDR